MLQRTEPNSMLLVLLVLLLMLQVNNCVGAWGSGIGCTMGMCCCVEAAASLVVLLEHGVAKCSCRGPPNRLLGLHAC